MTNYYENSKYRSADDPNPPSNTPHILKSIASGVGIAIGAVIMIILWRHLSGYLLGISFILPGVWYLYNQYMDERLAEEGIEEVTEVTQTEGAVTTPGAVNTEHTEEVVTEPVERNRHWLIVWLITGALFITGLVFLPDREEENPEVDYDVHITESTGPSTTTMTAPVAPTLTSDPTSDDDEPTDDESDSRDRERAERERIERERAEREAAESEQGEREAREQADRERERAEQERRERERVERERAEQEQRDREQREQEQREQREREQREQEQREREEAAVRSAEGHLRATPLSERGLFNQLVADGYPAEVAQHAVDNVTVDWNDNAVEAAERHRDRGMSEEDVLRQLMDDKFTRAQAEYAVSQAF